MFNTKRLCLASLCLVMVASCAKADISVRLSLPSTGADQPHPIATVTLPQAARIEAEPDYCLDCHADKEQLISTAKPEELVESESKGVG